MLETLSIAIAIVALAVSGFTAWLTLLRRGTVQMTQPTVIFFGPDDGRPPERRSLPKVFLRTLLFSTAKRGQILESMFVTLRYDDQTETFGIWVYGDTTLARGSGLYVTANGVSCNHHFLLPDNRTYRFSPGRYTLEVYATLLGNSVPKRLWGLSLDLSGDLAAALNSGNAGVYFDWNPQRRTYHSHVDLRPEPPALPPWLALSDLQE